MRKLTIRMILALSALAAFTLVALPGTAGTLYKWVAEDGTVAFSDDIERVPERYRAKVEARETKGLGDFERFSPTDDAAQAEYRERLAARLERLRALNAALESGPQHVARTHPSERPGFEAVVEVNDSTSVRVPSNPGLDGPVVVEEVRVLRDGDVVTAHDTVIRQGDDILMVIRPDHWAEHDPSRIIDEDDLLGR